jgi:imidazolonepropionase-like amidohydrolase
VIGSDSGSLGQFHHDAVWREMLAWRRLGAAPVEIIDAATRNPARMFEHNDIGTLSIGARGDVLLYRGDILGGEFDRAKVEAVIKGGVIFVEGGDWTGPDTETMRDDIRRARKHKQP